MDPLTYIAILVASTLISFALTKYPKVKAAALEDFELPTAEEGKELPMHFGSPWANEPNVLWYGDLRTKTIKKKVGLF